MRRKTAILALCFAGIFPLVAGGFSSDTSSLTRTFSKTVALTNSPVHVTVTFTNGCTNALRGFLYSEQLPSGLTVSTTSAKVNGQSVTNFVFESGQEGDVYAGYTPWRWCLETPTNFPEAHPLPAQATLQINYTVSSPTKGVFPWPQFVWAGYGSGGTNTSFGCSGSLDQHTVTFLTTTNRPRLSATWDTSGCMLWLHGDAGATYVLDVSTNLQTWVPLTTNVSSFWFTDTNRTGFSRRLYRGRLLAEGM
jgi:uncharacterized repeat protein (TIGR01451 family)